MKSIIRRVTSTALAAAMVLSMTPAFDISTDAASVPEGFVYTKGTKFMCDGAPFYYGGTNCYYLIYKEQDAVQNVLDDCVDMGLSVIRTWGHLDVGVKADNFSDSNPVFNNSRDGQGQKDGVYFQYFDKTLNKPVVNEGANGLRRLDYVIAEAEKRGLKLIITFTNYWEAFGGMDQYCLWMTEAGYGSFKRNEFYTNEIMKGWYKDYIKTLLNHTNYYTGEKLMDSEAVFAWELCNEPRVDPNYGNSTSADDMTTDMGCTKDVLYNWAKEMSEYVKSIDPYHMVSIGDEGFFNYGKTTAEINEIGVDSYFAFTGDSGVDFEKLMTIDTVDFGTPHMYCDQWNMAWKTDSQGISSQIDNGKDDDMDWLKLHAKAAQEANKPIILEEFGLSHKNSNIISQSDKSARDPYYQKWMDLITGTSFDGEYEFQGFTYWMIGSRGSDSQGFPNGYYPDWDGYTIYGNAEDDAKENPNSNARQIIIDAAAKMNAKNICNLVDPDEVSFDKSNSSDVVLTAKMKMGSPSSVKLNGTALSSSNYSISGTTITIKSSYLKTLEPSKYEFTLVCTEGNNPTFTIDVDDSSITPAIIDKESVTIDKNPKKCTDVTINMTLNGSTLKGINNKGVALVQGSDYTVSGSTVTIKKSYLTTLAEGNATLTFDFSPAKDKTLSIKVEDTTGADEFDVFDSYSSSDDLWSAYSRNTNGDEVSLSLTTKNGSQALAYGYNIGGSGYCGVTKGVNKDFSVYKGISLWIEGDGSGNEITIQLEDSDGRYREAYITLDFTGGKTVFIPFSDFVAPSWQSGSDSINSAKITKFSIYTGGSGKTSGTIYFDNIIAADKADEPETTKDISDCSVSLSGYSFDYTGSAITPTVTVKNGSTTLTKGTDYTVSYSNNVNAGTATVTVTGMGNYTGSTSVSFTINSVVTSNDIADCTITLSSTSFEYSGSPIKPKVTVKSGSKTLTLGTDYLVRYVNNIEAGTATVVIAGKGNYTGRVEKTFTIVKSSNNIA
ncbi:MAG: CIA30 family protein, partial [Hominimerdicola sp.]